VGQEEAISAISRALRRSRSGLKDPNRPIGSFIFLGPTGVGKTLLARALAEFMFGNENALIQIDMSEYMEKFAVSRMVGSPPGYVGFEEGGQLTEQVRRRPYAVVLFDEVEKAHPDVMGILLQIMEDGKLTDSWGRPVDFRNTVVIMTSNAGADLLQKETTVGFGVGSKQEGYEGMRGKLMAEMKKIFKPEFLNRIDDIIVFHHLDKPELMQIADLEIKDIAARLKESRITIELTTEAKEFIVKDCEDKKAGARPIRRALQRLVEDPLAEEMLRGRIPPGSRLQADLKDGAIVFVSAKE
ncbi:MAG: ATP-dependent Clp protease ATP-binding subunit, partial [Candidatus Aureabacteria bacterium]|nr:ATP-dependent Clp protease ATP-binding subunit [Candidatus Auribacterota bacterium]